MAAPLKLTRTHRILIGVVVAGAVVIAAIGFAGSYAAVRELAEQKGFGKFSLVFPIGIDAGICVLLALDLLLTWIRIPFPLLRQTAWLLTAATIAFNGAAAWPDPLGTAMHAVIPILFVISVEAARHAIGRIADITADKHMEGVRLTRWLLSPVPTFLLWRRMKLWELRSYDAVIKLEQERLVYRARLRSRYGRAWRRKAPVESLMPLRLARYGVPLAETAPAGLAAAGIEPPQLPASTRQLEAPQAPSAEQPVEIPQEWPTNHDSPWFATPPQPGQGQQPTPSSPGGDSSTSSLLEPPSESEGSAAGTDQVAAQVTTVDRYFAAWEAFQLEYGVEPSVVELAEYLKERRIYSPQGKSVTAAGLRRYPLSFRLYAVYAHLRDELGTEPAAQQVAAEAALRGITGQYSRPIDAQTLTEREDYLPDFRRRYKILTFQWTSS
ncbi:DUF2637 domain-containing protein [Streptomyces mesophilus]|nr:DUF2637 domain-containing protein [Streptomyces mesophilus]